MMKRVVLAVAAVALLGASAYAEDMDVKALAAKLAAQEARMADQDSRMRDLEAKLYCDDGGGTAESLTSLRKNATVTIGGLVTTGVYVGKGTVDSRGFGPVAEDSDATRATYKATTFEVSDAELYAQIEVNEHFDAFLSMDLHSTGEEAANQFGIAKSYYIRWKNICNSGFGLKIGRDDAAFGDSENAAGYLDGWAAGGGDGAGKFEIDGLEEDIIVPMHNGWKYEGITQFTPYWEGLDGALTMELSLFQNAWNSDGYMNGTLLGETAYYYGRDGKRKYRSRNLGLGSGSFRVQYSPIEDLTFTAGVINFNSKAFPYSMDPNTGETTPGEASYSLGGLYRHASNNTAVNLAFRYTPCFFDRLTVWGQYVRGWNVGHIKDYDTDAINAGFSLGLTDCLTYFVQGDYVRSKWKGNDAGIKGNSYAFYTGLTYEMPMGAVIEAGWRHEYTKWKGSGNNMPVRGVFSTGRADTIYANIGFEF